MITMAAKKLIWEPSLVIQKMDKKKARVLERSGRILRGAARRLIKSKKKLTTHSKPGNPPFTHEGKRHKNLLKESIVYSVLPDNNSVVIGPSGRAVDFIGALHEFGLKRRMQTFNPEFMRKLKIGGGGPVSARKFAGKIIAGAEYTDPLDGSPVIWAKLKTRRMLEHSIRLQKRLAKATGKSKTIDYPKRSFMGKALMQVEKKLPALWRKRVG